MADIVDLQDRPAPTKDDLEFVVDMARFSEWLLHGKGDPQEIPDVRRHRLAKIRCG